MAEASKATAPGSTLSGAIRRNRRLLVGLGVIVVVIAIVCVFFWSGLFQFQPEEGETFWHLLHQKGHWYLEVMISGVETILFDVIVGVVGWRYLLKPYIADRQAKAIAEEHALHGIEDHDHELHESIAHARDNKPLA
jgi:hypothetical protein